MQEHDEICLCFHVTLHKVIKYIRLNNPKMASQISECYGAGTGCGWCIPFLEKTFECVQRGEKPDLNLTRDEYVKRRKAYHRSLGTEVPGKTDASKNKDCK